MWFAKDILEAEKALKEMGHEPIIPIDTHNCVENPNLNTDIQHCIENDVMRDHYDKIQEADAILILNHHKKGIDNYVGANTLIEMGIAHFLGKKIFLLNSVPELSCAVEIQLMDPVMLNGDLNKIDQAST
jgi:nucleoside 2-deoxyribosyltransferase